MSKKLKITIDFGDTNNYVSEETIRDIISDKIHEDIKMYFKSDINEYVKNYLYSQMERFADLFIKDNPDLQKVMEDNIRKKIIEDKSYDFYLFSAPETYDRKIRPGYAMMESICRDPDVRATAKQGFLDSIKERFAGLSGKDLIEQLTDCFYDFLHKETRDCPNCKSHLIKETGFDGSSWNCPKCSFKEDVK